MKPIETERKFLARMPETSYLQENSSAQFQMEQTYLVSPSDVAERVRKRIGDKTQYFHTTKTRISKMSCVEDEQEIGEERYRELLQRRDPDGATIHKTRYCIPMENGLQMEIDCYSFWTKICTVEIELPSETTSFVIPKEIAILRELTGEKKFSNKALYYSVPEEDDLLCE